MRITWLALLLGLRIQAAEVYTEAWNQALEWPGGRAAWGGHHVWLEERSAVCPEEQGFPVGVVGVLPVQGGSWVALADGRLTTLGAREPRTWQVERACWAVAATEAEDAWIVGPGGLRRLALHGPLDLRRRRLARVLVHGLQQWGQRGQLLERVALLAHTRGRRQRLFQQTGLCGRLPHLLGLLHDALV